MRTLIAYYSRTGMTKKVAEAIKAKTGWELEEIVDTKNRKGAMGYLSAGKDAMQKNETILKDQTAKPADYDLVIIGTPIWAWNVSTPIRTYLNKNKGSFNKIAFFCTMDGNGDKKAFAEMELICGLAPASTLALTDKEIIDGSFLNKIDEFIKLS